MVVIALLPRTTDGTDLGRGRRISAALPACSMKELIHA
jgi:hypothetical protein